MARISTYDFDGTLSNTDKVIGTDSSNTTTKNFRVQDLKEFIYAGISGPLSINSSGTATVTSSSVSLGSGSGNYVATLTGGVGIDSTGATSGATTNHTLSLDLSELSTVTSISTGNHVAISPSNAGNLITVDNLFIKSPKLVSEAAIANGDYMLFLDGGATGDMKKESLSDISTLFAGTGLTSSSSVINLDLNSLSAKTSIVQADSLSIVDSEDSNTNKKVTYAILEDEIYSNISGDITINSSGVSAIGADKVKGTMLHSSAADTNTIEVSSDTLSVIRVPNALTAGTGIKSNALYDFDGSDSTTFSLDLDELSDATIANGDSIVFIDVTDTSAPKKETLSDFVTFLAGDGLAASSSVLSVGVDNSTIETNSDVLRVKDAGITAAKLNTTAITGQTDLGANFADADTILLHDATASALREGTMANLASYVNASFDLESSLESLNASDNVIKIGHSSDKVQIIGNFQVDGTSTLTGNTTVTGSLTANGLTFPANSAGSNDQLLAKTSDGTIGFVSGSVSVSDDSTDANRRLVFSNGNNLLDNSSILINPSNGNITLPSASVLKFDDSTDFTLTHISDTGIRINGTQELQFGSANSKIKESSSGVLELTASTTVDINSSDDITVDAADNITVTAADDLSLVTSSADGLLTISSAHTAGQAIHIDANAASNGSILDIDAGVLDIDVGGAATLDAVGVAIGAGSGELDLTTTATLDINANALDMDLTDSSSITITSSEAGEDLTISQVGGNDSSIIIEAAGTGTDAIKLNASAGSIDVDSGDNITVNAIDDVTITSGVGVHTSQGLLKLHAPHKYGHIHLLSNNLYSGQGGGAGGVNEGILLECKAYATSKIKIDSGTSDIYATHTINIKADSGSDQGGYVNILTRSHADSLISLGASVSEVKVLDDLTVVGTSVMSGLTYPTSDGSNGQVLTTNGSGTLSFGAVTATGVTINADTTNTDRNVLFNNGNTIHDQHNTVSSSAFKFNPSTNVLTVNNIVPKTNDGGTLGSSSLSYSDLFLADGGIIKFGNDQDVTLTHIADTGVELNGASKLRFRDADLSINSSTDGELNLNANAEIQIEAPSLNIDSNDVDISGNLVVNGSFQLSSSTAVTGILDEDNMASNSAVSLATQQSIKAFVESQSNTVAGATDTNISSPADGHILIYDAGTSKFRNFVISGDATMDDSGALSLADDSVDSAELVDGSVDNSHLAGSIANAKLSNSSITVSDGSSSTAVALGSTISFAGGEGMDVSESSGTVTFSAEDSTASNKGAVIVAGGNAIDVSYSSGTATVNHSDTSSVSNVDNSGDTFIQDLTFDTYGHVTGVTSATASTNSSTFTVSANNSTNETVFPVFVDGATGSQGAETDTGLFYNPSTGKLTSESFTSKGNTNSKGGVINLSTTDAAITANEILGTIEFQAPDEANGNDAALVAAEIRAVAEETFNDTSNDTKFEFITSTGEAITSSTSPVVTISSAGNVTASGLFEGTNFKTSSDKRLKSEIEPIKEGLEVIKQFASYTYIKGGEKESGFIAQEVREAIPHTVYENNEGYLSMSDRGVLAHMHKAILEIDKRLEAIEEKLK